MADVMYPIVIKIKPEILELFLWSEEGAYEDSLDLDSGTDSSPYGEVHGYTILSRHKDKIVINNAEEATEIYYRAVSGTFQIDRRDEGGTNECYKKAVSICNQLREIAEYVDPELVKNWRAPSGM